jgi:hypothetical protein
MASAGVCGGADSALGDGMCVVGCVGAVWALAITEMNRNDSQLG